MRQIVALNPADEEQFLAAHPNWSMERRFTDPDGVVWLSLRVDQSSERKAILADLKPRLLLQRATNVLKSASTGRTFPIYLGAQPSWQERRIRSYRPEPCELQAMTVIAPPFDPVPPVRSFR